MIRDASRSEVEALYEFQSLMASGGSAAVWRVVERATAARGDQGDRQEAAAAVAPQHGGGGDARCSGYPNIAALLAAFDLPPDEASPDGEWHQWSSPRAASSSSGCSSTHTEKVSPTSSSRLRRPCTTSTVGTHRDIKPENIVLMSDDEAAPVKLIDFGAALVLEEGEQVIRGGKVDVDVCPSSPTRTCRTTRRSTCGAVVLYIMLSGRHPFEKARASADDVLQGILDANYS